MNNSFYTLLFLCTCVMVSCQTGINSDSGNSEPDSVFFERIIKTSPPLTPNEALRSMIVEEGFEVKLVASEPLVSTPVALNFDRDGRIWVVEMEGFMPNAEGDGEEVPTGKIVILEDKNGDGVSDGRKVFLDSLVLPRAICLIEDGVLVAEPPFLSYYEIKNDKPGRRVIVDSVYAIGNNVEHQPNGLLRALDNWIYSSDSDKRYRKVGNKWLTGKTHLRGQWGITQDDYGRLFYNNNSQNLLGDFYSASVGANNFNQRKVLGFNEVIVKDNSLYPVRPNSGVNRGYQENILDKNNRLRNFTAASGPVIYRGNLLGKEYYQNAFVGEPAANLIKRDIINDDASGVKGKQAYQEKEFLASYDERFRPVTLYNGPDGALYIVDMYRGIIQHKLYLTDYLKGEINKRLLEQPLNYGRIYKVVPENASYKRVKFPEASKKLVKLLGHENGWVRDKAQQLIIDNRKKDAIPQLRENLKSLDNPLMLIHSLWTLEGLVSLNFEDVLPLLSVGNNEIRIQALTVMPSILNARNYNAFLPALKQLIKEKDSIAAPYIAFQVYAISKVNREAGKSIMLDLVRNFPTSPYIADAIISNLEGEEAAFYKEISTVSKDTSLQVTKRLGKVLADLKMNETDKDIKFLKTTYPRGASLFQSTCQACHGVDGNGIESLAPPLNNSNWVNGNKEKLIAIVLYGLQGPVAVNNKLYDKISGEMPGIAGNKTVVDEDIAQLLSFVRKNWSNNTSEVSREEVIKIRKKFDNRQNAFTVAELDKW